MSQIIYNGITIPYAFHTYFQQEVVYDDMGGTDWTCTKFDIEIQAVINSDYANMIYPALEGITDNPAVFMKAIRTALLRPRRQLQVTFNGVDLIPAATGGPGTVDVKNGPQPKHCNITQLTNTTFLVTYRIVAHYWENNSVDPFANDPPDIVTNAAGNSILFNRWTESVEIDGLGYTKRIREGKFVIRSDNQGSLIADQLRSQMAVVGVPAGFLRESARYTVSADGLAIMYNIVDQEVFKNPPFPAFKATGTYTETSPLNGVMRILECQLRLEGPKNVPQAQLVSRAIAIVMSKIGEQSQILNPLSPSETIPIHQGVRVGMYENWVEVTVRVKVPVTQERTNNINFNLARMVYTPGSDASFAGGPGAPTPAYSDRGTGVQLIQAAAYYDPNIVAAVLDKTTGQLNPPGLEVGQAGANQE